MLKFKYFFLSIIIVVFILGCDKEENPNPVEQLIFSCYNPAVFGPLKPEIYDGLPAECFDYILFETFTNNKLDWQISSDGWISYKIINGNYEITTKSMYSYNFITFNNFTIPDTNYQIEFKLKFTQSIENSRTLGITFNGENWQYNFFGITKQGNAVFGENQSQNSPNILLDSKPYINNNEYKSITVRNFRGITYMFLDEILIFKKAIPYVGNELGYIIPQNSQVYIDEIQIKEFNGIQ